MCFCSHNVSLVACRSFETPQIFVQPHNCVVFARLSSISDRTLNSLKTTHLCCGTSLRQLMTTLCVSAEVLEYESDEALVRQ